MQRWCVGISTWCFSSVSYIFIKLNRWFHVGSETSTSRIPHHHHSDQFGSTDFTHVEWTKHHLIQINQQFNRQVFRPEVLGVWEKKQQTFGKRRGYLSFAYLWLATFNMKCIVRLVEEVFRKLHRVARCLTIARGLWIIHTYIRICSTYSHIIHKIILHRCNCCILMLTRKILRMKRQDACYNTEMEVK